MFGLCFYVLTKRRSDLSKYSGYSVAIFETSTLGVKNIFCGIIHGMFLANNALQVSLLIIVKLFLIIVLLKVRKRYQEKY